MLKKNIEGYWFCNFSTPDELLLNKKANFLLINKKEYLLGIYKDNYQNSSSIESDKELDVFNVEFGQKINSPDKIIDSASKHALKSVQKYILSFNQTGIVLFQNFEKKDRINLKIDTSKIPQVSLSGKYLDKYIFHLLIESKTKMHLSLFEIQNNTKENISYTGSWLQIHFLKDVNRSPLTRFEKSWQFILLATIFITGYIFGFHQQNKNLEQRKAELLSQNSSKKSQITNAQMNEIGKLKKD